MGDTAGPANQDPVKGALSVLQPPTSARLREMLVEMVRADLLGPAGGPEEEMAEDRVRERYLVGMLAPRRSTVTPETLDDLATSGPDSPEEGTADLTVAQQDSMLPSSLGLSFVVDGKATGLRVTARWGRYTRQQSETAIDRKTGKPLLIWRRAQIEGVSGPIPLQEGAITPWVVTDEHPEVTVQGRMRQRNGDWVITLFLVNGQEERKQRKDEAWLFQPELRVESAGDGESIFCKRLTNSPTPEHLDPLTRTEREAMAMLYRCHVEFAVGHGVAVHAEADGACPDRAKWIETRILPVCEVPQQTPPRPGDPEYVPTLLLDMKELSETPQQELGARLRPLVEAYGAWIQGEEAKIADPASGLAPYQSVAAEAVARCKRALERIEAGITLLEENETAAQAFCFANRAMWLQRTHTLFAREVRKGRRKVEDGMADIDIPRNRTWYPFQLAFILLNLPGLTDLHHPDRAHDAGAIADLLWFPTGGGKTEAYLGLTAYTMALRRLQGEVEGRSGEHGVAVLMRYTLRLLTLQQFQRAAALICACETLRREDPDRWGGAPFRIGLWVGMRATPNTTVQAQEAIAQDHGAAPGSAYGTPAQLTACPWCGTAIHRGQHIKVYAGMSTYNRTVIYCGDPLGNCPFSERNSPYEGIPALVVDEEIYRNPPSLLIATVDKFAQMPWKGEVQMLFGQVSAHCPRHGFRSPEIEDANSHPRRGALPAVHSSPHAPLRPPDLIIQDELHLISGPLGSLVGLYETAVDELASWTVAGKQVRPKVIASTATIRRAQDQVNRLFLRSLEVFPPHGTEIGNNFFSIQRDPSEEYPGRLYLGVCAVGRRYPALLIRSYVALMAAAQKLYTQYDAAVDPWMTLVGYFNAIRELGGARRLVEDEVSALLLDADQRGLARRWHPILEELTSRKGSSDIPAILDRLDIGFNEKDQVRRQAQRKAGQRIDPPYPLDVVLATNMISVGVDVDRLGLMVVAGQPKATAEYIQATSRVGRRFPGLVCTLYNWARPRDLSHYETFEHYHATFYQHVEALSVTPFAARALDRGLSGVLVALVRLAAEKLNANKAAGKLEREEALLLDAMQAIIERGELVMGDKAVGDEIKQMLQDRRDDWLKQVQLAITHQLGYKGTKDGVTVGLLKQAGAGPWERFTCLNSLRDVEVTANLILAGSHGLEPTAGPAYVPAAQNGGDDPS